jgi:hypothetical protein
MPPRASSAHYDPFLAARGASRSGAPHDCPSDVDQQQLEDLHLIIKYPEEKKG